MQIQIQCQGVEYSRWMEEFIGQRILRLDRYISPSAKIQVSIANDNDVICTTTITIHNPNHNFNFCGEGENVYESFSFAIEEAHRSLAENRRRFKGRMARRSSLIREYAA